MPKFLVVEDNAMVANAIRDCLLTQDYQVEIAHDGADASQLLANFDYDLVLLDWDLPGLSGIEILKRFRKQNSHTPVIFITGKITVDNKEKGLDFGADDYLTKPFEPRELLARIRTVMRRGRAFEVNPTFRNTELDVRTSLLKTPKGAVTLSFREAKILELLYKNPTQIFSSVQIFNKVWELHSDVQPDTVRVHMHILRRKLALKDCKDLIETVPNAGYRLNGEFEF